MRNRSHLLLFWARTFLVLLLLGLGIGGEMARTPLVPAAMGTEQLQNAETHLAGLPAENFRHSQRAAYAVPPEPEPLDGALAVETGLLLPPVAQFDYVAVPRAPPRRPEWASWAHGTRAPPVFMI